MEQVFKLLDSLAPVEPDLRDFLSTHLEPFEFKKKELIVKEGSIARYLGFIEEGMIRGYRFDEKENEHTSWIMTTGDVYASVWSYFTQSPARENVEAIKPTIARCLSFESLQFALKTWPSFHKHRADLLQRYYLQSLEREYMRQQGAYQRFCFMMEHYSKLEAEVEDKYLAGFLSLVPQYYSDQKKRYFKEHPRR
jgi:CRP-like cAMP-binding protein